jgi:hypothetical protein
MSGNTAKIALPRVRAEAGLREAIRVRGRFRKAVMPRESGASSNHQAIVVYWIVRLRGRRQRKFGVIAGLDPAIHAEVELAVFAGGFFWAELPHGPPGYARP